MGRQGLGCTSVFVNIWVLSAVAAQITRLVTHPAYDNRLYHKHFEGLVMGWTTRGLVLSLTPTPPPYTRISRAGPMLPLSRVIFSCIYFSYGCGPGSHPVKGPSYVFFI
jgi:hypothetical protein